ncbi:MAG: threonine dehydratase [Alphaproteobacteria bacterium]|nr:threonine dehydratase [Alphaproteobacteria bacterium]MBX3717696.1 threonine dehydratase [Burkholderiales bacterium]MCW5743032.1 threonine dehydratase [Alphaproteobacteria bacterium]
MPLLTVADYEAAQRVVYGAMPPTPQYAWPLLARRVGTEVWVKHENHTPTGAFKVRGGLVYMDRLKRERPQVRGVISATRGNHGQSVAFAAARNGVRAVILVPHGNSVEKNAAMRAFGAELIEHGHDFDAAREQAVRIAPERGLEMLPSFHMDLVRGVGTYALELFRGAPELDTVYAPIGLGSGICGLITARNALGLKTKIVGCVSTNAPAYALSFVAKKPVETNSADTFADGVAVRVPSAEALDIMLKGAERIVQVSDAEIEEAMRAYYTDTHQLAEGAGAVPLAGLMQERERMRGRKVAVILSGGNIDRPVYARVIAQDRASAPTPDRS